MNLNSLLKYVQKLCINLIIVRCSITEIFQLYVDKIRSMQADSGEHSAIKLTQTDWLKDGHSINKRFSCSEILVYGRCSLSDILKTRKHKVSEIGSVSVFR
jgi:hypothetical protein